MKHIDEKCLDRFRGPGLCERCRRGQTRRDPHHCFIKKGMGGASTLDLPENLLSLCRACHDKAEASSIENSLCKSIIVLREFPLGGPLWVLPSEVHDWLKLVQFAPKEGAMPERPWLVRPERYRHGSGLRISQARRGEQ